MVDPAPRTRRSGYGSAMPPHRPRLTLWGTGEYVLASEGGDGSATVLTVDAAGSAAWARDATLPGVVYDRELRGELDGPWRPEVIHVPVAGGRATIERSGDGTGHFWEKGHRPQTVKDGWLTPAHDWVTIWHPSRDAQHPGGGRTRESVTLGTSHEPGGRATYTTVTVVEKDRHGHETQRVSVTDRYSHRDGSRDHDVVIRHADGSSVHQTRHTTKDGHWEDTTTTRDKDGHYTRHHSTGTGSRTETYEKTESDEDPEPGQDTPDPEPPDTDSPLGDGTGGDEGNPDGPLAGLDAVTLRRLLGEDWEGPEEFDTLGDVDAALRPFMDRIRATLASGATSGGGSPGELLDTLGAPPIVGLDLTGVEEDELADHDSLGRPPPLLRTELEAMARDPLRTSALTVTELQGVAESFALTAATVAQSVAVLRNP
jgi:hypothetical protein